MKSHFFKHSGKGGEARGREGKEMGGKGQERGTGLDGRQGRGMEGGGKCRGRGVWRGCGEGGSPPTNGGRGVCGGRAAEKQMLQNVNSLPFGDFGNFHAKPCKT